MKHRLATLSLLASLLPCTTGAWTPDALLIWINGDKGYEGIAEVGARFSQATGVPLHVEHPEGAPDKFFQAARSGKGPDVMIWAHDRLGEWADVGLLMPLPPSPAFTNRIFPKALAAFMHRERLWGYPISMETSSLIYNKALISEENIPANLADCTALLPSLAKKGALPIMWDYNNAYFTWGLLTADGGYVFGQQPNGEYILHNVGVDSPPVIAAAETLASLIHNHTIPSALSYSVAEAKMNQGQVAMFISGPFAWANLEKSGVDFGVTTIPGFNNKPARPFVGVLGAMLNRSSPNLDLAQEFLENWLITPDGLRAMDRHVPLGVPALKSFYQEKAADPRVAGTMKNVEQGQLMPNVPQMGLFWSAMKSALSTITSFSDTPQNALKNAAERMKSPP